LKNLALHDLLDGFFFFMQNARKLFMMIIFQKMRSCTQEKISKTVHDSHDKTNNQIHFCQKKPSLLHFLEFFFVFLKWKKPSSSKKRLILLKIN